ncbi:(S)-mandelate dehydrogenase [Candidatus Nitrotoga sp. HW29]|uniref:alpha-hydroxy-acid oxidizing protein n=1 Tax=Candidatus Nitrotoga sp. HW29 TaxID=2886963 RepID=UPI001EF34313|nr:alpha-hydroxy-acid oxidizing protein [Candidatus Nitrotoga sp. HW29]CAH1905347.1 (S)-mandelate dehydrogenase [Candidatus Nitrotoga sp. HW29]
MSISRRDFLLGTGFGAAGLVVGAGLPTLLKSDVPSVALNVFDYQKLAKNRLPGIVFDYLEGGSGSERALHHNLAVFEKLSFKPRRLVDISHRKQGITLFGKPQTSPFMIGPTGGNSALWPNADLALARAAKQAGIPFTLSTPAGNSIEEVAKGVDSNKWFQLYVSNREQSKVLAKRALTAGYTTLVLTIDVAVNGLRERDQRNGFKIPMDMTPSVILDGITHPRWSMDYVVNPPQLANFVSDNAADIEAQTQAMNRNLDATFDWAALRQLREIWPRTLLVKGILNADDAVQCIENGADGIILSNHGGRQLGEALSPLQVLAETRRKVDKPILIDSGFRRGADIIKALALGANCVLLGRATLYGVAANGQEGVSDVISILQNEIDNILAQIGCADVNSLNPSYLHEDSVRLMQSI